MPIEVIDKRQPEVIMLNKNIPNGTVFTGIVGDDERSNGVYLKIGDLSCSKTKDIEGYPGRILRLNSENPMNDITIGRTWDSSNCPVKSFKLVRLEMIIYEP